MVAGPELTSLASAAGRGGPAAGQARLPGPRPPVPRRGTAGGPRGARARRRHASLELFVTRDAATRHAEIVAAAESAGVAGGPGQRRGRWRRCRQTVTPQGLVAVCRFLDVPLADVLAGGRPRWSPSSRTSATPATPAPSSAPPTPPAPTPCVAHRRQSSTPTTASACGPRPAASSTCRSRRRRRSTRGLTALRAAGLRVLAADGHGELDLDERSRRRAARRPDRLGVRQRGLGPAASRPGRSPTRSSGCRSTAGPRASTSPPPPRSASTPRPGPATHSSVRLTRRRLGDRSSPAARPIDPLAAVGSLGTVTGTAASYDDDPDGVVVADARGTVVVFNPAARADHRRARPSAALGKDLEGALPLEGLRRQGLVAVRRRRTTACAASPATPSATCMLPGGQEVLVTARYVRDEPRGPVSSVVVCDPGHPAAAPGRSSAAPSWSRRSPMSCARR